MTDNEERTIWQVGAGERGRSYADVFLKHSIALIGPGDPGSWSADRDDDDFGGRFVRWFASEIDVGDMVVLRVGTSGIKAVGIVADEEYKHLPQFGDVNGWDLQHARRVRWAELPKEHDFGEAVFGPRPSRLSRTWNEDVRDFVERFLKSPPTAWQQAELPDLPIEEPDLEEDKVPPFLRSLAATAVDMYDLYWDYEEFGDQPSEHEAVAHFVVPLLRTLGWRPEQIALEWRAMDIALFRKLPRTEDHCHLVIEAKRPGRGIQEALGQAREYVSRMSAVCDIVVTDGLRYRYFDSSQDYKQVGYAHLAHLKSGALDLFERMRPPRGG